MSGFICSMVGASFVTAVAEVIRAKKGIKANGNAQIDTAQSKFGGASALFDGTGDYLVAPGQISLGTNDWTVECFIRVTSAQAKVIWETRAGSSDAATTSVQADSTLAYYDPTIDTVKTTNTYPTNSFFHACWERNGSTLRIYINGVVGRTVTGFGSDLGSARPLTIGAVFDGSASLNGHIDEFRVSNTARYNGDFTPTTTAFVNDANTLILIHANGTDGSTFFEDDNGSRAPIGLIANNQAQISTAQAQFGGSSALFDGNNDFIGINALPSFASSDFTFECWARFDILPHNQTLDGGSYIMLNSADSSNYMLINRSGSGSQVSIQIANVGQYGSFTKSGVNYAINTWYHIAVVRTGGVHKCFFNGTELTTFTNDSGFTNSGRTSDIYINRIGTFVDARGSMDGYLDEIRVSNSARYTGGDFTPSTTAFVNDANTRMLMHANGTNGSTVFLDDVGVRAQRGIAAIGNAQVDTAQSKFGGASALFDGNDYLQIIPATAAELGIGSGDFTIEFFVRFAGVTSTGLLIDSRGDPQNSNGWALYINSGTLRWYQGATDRITSSSLSTNTLYHIAISRSGNDHKMFVDGTQTGSTYTAANTYVIGLAAYGLWIGNSQPFPTQGFNGHMDEVRISNTARYTTTFTPSTTAFVNDANTLLLIHADGTDASTVFTDDNGVTPTHSYA